MEEIKHKYVLEEELLKIVDLYKNGNNKKSTFNRKLNKLLNRIDIIGWGGKQVQEWQYEKLRNKEIALDALKSGYINIVGTTRRIDISQISDYCAYYRKVDEYSREFSECVIKMKNGDEFKTEKEQMYEILELIK